MIDIEWINETLQHYKDLERKRNWRISAEKKILMELCATKEFIRVGKSLGNEKTQGIMQTIESNLANKYFKVTDNMKLSITSDLLSHYSFEYIAETLCTPPKLYYAYIYNTTTKVIIAKAKRNSEHEAIQAVEAFVKRIHEPHACTTNDEGLLKPFYIEQV